MASSLFLQHNTALVPPYRVLIDTNFINFSLQNKLELVSGMMDCLYAKCEYSIFSAAFLYEAVAFPSPKFPTHTLPVTLLHLYVHPAFVGFSLPWWRRHFPRFEVLRRKGRYKLSVKRVFSP